MLANQQGVNSLHTHSAPYGYAPALGTSADAGYAEQTRRRAARWHAWLKSPECTLQDRENFERWCSDPVNAAAYVALCGGLAWAPELASDFADDGTLALQGSPPLVADR
jgi:ferric-dicitrate binding protein FerR (iron transport regulator)